MVSQNATTKPTAYKTLRLFIDIAVATQHPQRKGLYEGNSRYRVTCLSERLFFNEYGKNGSQFAGRFSYEPIGIYQVSALIYTQILTT